MLRQLAKTTAKRQHHGIQRTILRPQVACLSTAPRPQEKSKISMSYAEWAAQTAAASKMIRQEPKRTRQAPSQRRTKPQKYNSVVHLPDTVSLHFPHNKNDFQLDCVDFAIAKPGKGGHVVLGNNGSGKSLLVQQLAKSELFANGDRDMWTLPSSKEIGYVSFDSHIQALQDHPNQTVFDSITGGVGNLSKAAQYLVVRFGLFPILHRTLSTLSTGEIRKALLVSALAKQPKLLVLENAVDGLDANSRNELRAIVSKTIQGLGQSGKLLVQSVNAEYVPPAQVLLSTHRPEEIVDEVTTVSYIEQERDHNTLKTIPRPSSHSQEQLMFMALGLDKDHNKNTQNWSVVAPWDDEDPTLPSSTEIQQAWGPAKEEETDSPLLSLQDVTIRRRRDGLASKEEEDSEYATLLHGLNWDVQEGQRWLIAGGNGAGKSTLTRFLLQTNHDDKTTAEQSKDTTKDLTSGSYQKEENASIGWVSTESHLGQVGKEGITAWDVICHNGEVEDSVAETMAQWVFGNTNLGMLKERPLNELSQGEQKLALIASALALRPKVLILDEPTQGLDWVHRRRILALLERLCQANPKLSLAFITHYKEEWIPSISHVLHLDHGHAVYQGERKEYNPEKL